jgi:PAS domain S-box-containing protein
MNGFFSYSAFRRTPFRLGQAGLAVAGLVVLFILAGSTDLMSREFERTQTLREEVYKSFGRRAQLQAVLSVHQDIEIGQRGLVLTGDERFLEPYLIAKSRISRSMADLEGSLPADQSVQASLTLLRSLSAKKLAFVDRTIATERAGRRAEAASLIASGRGKEYMDGIRRAIAQIDGVEQLQLRERLLLSDSATLHAQRLSIGLQMLLLLLLVVAAAIIGRSFYAKQRTLRQIQDLNTRQATIFDAAKDGIIVLNQSGSIESLNPAAARLYGYHPDELVRRDVGILFEIAPDQGQIETFLKRMQRRRRSDAGSVQEIWGKRRDGSTFPGDVAVSPVQLAEGVKYVAIIRDMTERKQVEQMKTEFVSTVSHELRTPLTSIAGSLGLLAGGAVGTLPDPATRLVNVAHKNAQRLIRLINDILDIEKMESGAMHFDIRPLHLCGLLEQAVEANRGYAASYGVQLALAPVEEQARVMADSDRLTQAVTNLVSNAVKFSPGGQAVEIAAVPLDRRWRITVADRGPGIAEEFKARIFGKFAQADSSDTRQKGGTGLGLSIVKEIVVQHGGSVAFEDRSGGGTSFHIDLPSADWFAPAAAEQSAEEPLSSGLPRILHVDDDPDVLRLAAQAFASRAEVQPANSLAAARHALLNQSVDLVILDLALPDGSGLDLLAELDGAREGPRVVIFSAEDGDPALTRRADAHLIKCRAGLDQLVETVVGLLTPSLERRVA